MSEGRTIYIIGGTTEANLITAALQDEGFYVVASVATRLGEALAAARETEAGRKDAQAMAELAARRDAAAIVDCSHPFAQEASREARRAAILADIPYFRYTRAADAVVDEAMQALVPGDLIRVPTWEAAVAAVKSLDRQALLTIGTRNLGPFVEAGIDLTVRVLPTPQSLEECGRLGIVPADIIAAFPPHSVDFNRACIRRTGAGVLVTKDSGAEGGLAEKLAAAAAEGAAAVIVARPAEDGAIEDPQRLVEALRSELHLKKEPQAAKGLQR